MSESAADDAMPSSEDNAVEVYREFDPEKPLNLVDRSEEARAAVDRVVIFSINGKPYTVPNETRPNVSMGYLYLTRTRGVAAAESWLAETLLGKEGYEALLNFSDLTQEQSNEIFQRARDVAFGKYDPKAPNLGNGFSTEAQRKPSGTRKSTRGSSKPRQKSSRTG